MDVQQLIEEINAAGENLSKEPIHKSQLSTTYCRKASKALDKITNKSDYNEVITGLWFVAAHLNEHLRHVKPVRVFTDLCLKLFRQCAKAILNIQWEKLEEDNSLRHNFLASLANLHTKLLPLKISQFHLLEALSESPWTHPTLAKVMGGELDDSNKEEVQCYIRNEDPIILQLRVDMMLKENCEEYALNLCNSVLGHPELQADLSVRKTQFFLLYKLGQEDKLQEECQKLSIKDAVHVIKQLQASKTHRKMVTVLTQTFMVQNWIRPSDMEASKELLRLWIVHQLLVDKEQDPFKESVWAMAKLSQSTDQIIVFIDVLREACGETFLQLYVDMCIFAINVDKGQMEISTKEGNKEAAAARRSDMASVCAKLSCLCHQNSIKVARMCALTAFALKPAEQSFAKIGAFYDQGSDCCEKCGRDQGHEQGTINPATLYEVERLLNMLRPDYLSPSHSYADIQILCRRYLQDSLRNLNEIHKTPGISEFTTDAFDVDTTENSSATESSVSTSSHLFESLCSQDVQNIQILLNRMNTQNTTATSTSLPSSTPCQVIYQPTTDNAIILQHGQSSSAFVEQTNNIDNMIDENLQNKHTSCELMKQLQHSEINHKNKLQQQQHVSEETPGLNVHLEIQQQGSEMIQHQSDCKKQVQDMITAALKQDSAALQRLTQEASPELLQTVLTVLKGVMKKPSVPTSNQQQVSNSQQITHTLSSSKLNEQQLSNSQQITHTLSSSKLNEQQLPSVSTLFRPSLQLKQQQKLPQPQTLQHLPQGQHLRPQLHVRPVIISTTNKFTPVKIPAALLHKTQTAPSHLLIKGRNLMTANSAISNNTQPTSASTASSASMEEQQKAQSFLLAKSRVEDIRHFLQSQLTNVEHRQITKPWQMSGSIVTLNNDSTNVTPDGPQYILTGKQPASVELSKTSNYGIPQVHEISRQNRLQQVPQQKINLGQEFIPQVEHKFKNQSQQLIITTSRTNTNLNLRPQSSEYQWQHNGAPSIEGIQSSAPNPVSSSSSGTILINGKLLQPIVSQKIQNSTNPQVHGYFTPSHPENGQFSVPQTPQASSVTTLRKQPQKIISISGLPSSYIQSPSVVGMNKCSALYVTTHALNSVNTISQSGLNWKLPIASFPNSNRQVLSSQEMQPNKITVSVKMPEDVRPKDATTEEVKKIDVTPGEGDKDAAVYRCIICSISFKILEHLQEHVKTVCRPGQQPSGMYSTKLKLDKTMAANAGVETTTVFQCLRCFELCISNSGMKQHRLVCRKIPPGMTSDGISGALTVTVSSPPVSGELTDISGNQPVNAELKGVPDNHLVNGELNGISDNQLFENELNDNSGNLPVNNELNDNSSDLAVNNELNDNSGNLPVNNELNDNSGNLAVNNEPNDNSSNLAVNNELNDNSGNLAVNNELNDNSGNRAVNNELNESCVNQSDFNQLTEASNNTSISWEPTNSHIQLVNGDMKDNSQTTPELMPPSLLLPLPASSAVENSTSESAISPPCPTIRSICINSEAPMPTADTAGHSPPAFTTFHPNLLHQILVTPAENVPASSVPAMSHTYTPQTIAAPLGKTLSYQTPLSKTPSYQTPLSIPIIRTNSIFVNADLNTPEPVHAFINDPLSNPHATEVKNSVNTCIKEIGVTEGKIGENGNSAKEAKLSIKTEEKVLPAKDINLSNIKMRCEICQTSCHTERILLQHFVCKHLKSYTANKSIDSSSYLCHFCQNTFATFHQLMHHVLDHSVTIYGKIKAITTNKNSQHFKRITSKSRLASKKSKSKMVKLMANTKAKSRMVKLLANTKAKSKLIISKLKRQLAHKRLIISQRKKQFLSRFASVNDNIYASGNAAFKPQKSALHVYSTYRLAMSRRRNAKHKELNKKAFCQQYEHSIQSPLYHSLEVNDQEIRGICNIQKGNNRGLNNNCADVLPGTKRRQFMKRKTSAPSKMGTQIKGIRKNGKHPCISDADSESSYLQPAQSNYGNFMAVSQITASNHTSPVIGEDRVNGLEFEPPGTLFTRSLVKEQKESLQPCNLHPKVVLEVLCPQNLEAAHHPGNVLAVATSNQKSINAKEKPHPGPHDEAAHHPGNGLAVTTNSQKSLSTKEKPHPRPSGPHIEATLSPELSTSASPKTPSFLDSYVSYLNNCQLPVKNANTNVGSREQILQIATNRLGSVHSGVQSQILSGQAKIPGGQSSAVPLQTNTNHNKTIVAPDDQKERSQKNILHLPDKNHDIVQNNNFNTTTRHCFVDLCQNLDPEYGTACRNTFSRNKIGAQDTPLTSFSANHIERDKTADPTTISSESLRIDAPRIPASFSLEKTEIPDTCVQIISTRTMELENENKEILSKPQTGHQAADEPASSGDDGDVQMQFSRRFCLVRCERISVEQLEKSKVSTDMDSTGVEETVHDIEKYDLNRVVAPDSHFHQIKACPQDTEGAIDVIPREIGIQAEGGKDPNNIEVRGDGDMMVVGDKKVIATRAKRNGEEMFSDVHSGNKYDVSTTNFIEQRESSNARIIQHRMMEINTQMQTSYIQLSQNGDDNMKHSKKGDIRFGEFNEKHVEPLPTVEKGPELVLGVSNFKQIDKRVPKYEQIGAFNFANEDQSMPHYNENGKSETKSYSNLENEISDQSGNRFPQSRVSRRLRSKEQSAVKTQSLEAKDVRPCVLNTSNLNGSLLNNVDFVTLGKKECCLVSATSNSQKTVAEHESSPIGDIMTPENNNLQNDSGNNSPDKETKLRMKRISKKWPRNISQATDAHRSYGVCISRRCDTEDSLKPNKSLTSKRAAEHGPPVITKRMKRISKKWPRNISQATDAHRSYGVCISRRCDTEDSLKPNKSLTSKRAAEHGPPVITKRTRTKQPPITQKLNRLSLSSPPRPSLHSPVHVTRSSGALNKKRLRNREITP